MSRALTGCGGYASLVDSGVRTKPSLGAVFKAFLTIGMISFGGGRREASRPRNLLAPQLRDLVPIDVFAEKTRELEDRKRSLGDRLANLDRNGDELGQRLREILDFAAAMRSLFARGTAVQQRIILETVGSNYVLKAKKVTFSLAEPLEYVARAASTPLLNRTSAAITVWGTLVDELRT